MKRNDLSFRIVETDSDKALAKEIVENHHSYVPTYKSVGRRLDWLIFHEGRLVGMIGIGKFHLSSVQGHIEAVEHKQGTIQEDVQLLRQQLAVLHEGKPTMEILDIQKYLEV